MLTTDLEPRFESFRLSKRLSMYNSEHKAYNYTLQHKIVR